MTRSITKKQNSNIFEVSNSPLDQINQFLISVKAERPYFKYLAIWFFPEADTDICNQEITELYSFAIQHPNVANLVVTSDPKQKIEAWIKEGGFDSHLHYKSDTNHVWYLSLLRVPISSGKDKRYLRSTLVFDKDLKCILMTSQSDYLKRDVESVFRFINNLSVESECNE